MPALSPVPSSTLSPALSPLSSPTLSSPTLSLCMIVKNEEQFLEQCLNSVKELVDEIIIVDTGSTDKTKEIAAKFTNKIYDFKWCDDFSAARNESLKYATGEWILVLDADEVVAKEDHAKIRILIENNFQNNNSNSNNNNNNNSNRNSNSNNNGNNIGHSIGYSLVQRTYTNDTSLFGFTRCPKNYAYHKDYLGWWDCFIVRMFRNDLRVRFKGEIHEVVDDSIKNMGGKKNISGEISVANIIIHHYCEDKKAPAKNAKLEKYFSLAKKKVQSEINNAQAHFQLGVILKQQGKFAEAEKELKEALYLEPELVVAQLDLSIILQKQEKWDEAINAYQAALEKKADFPEAYFGLGFCYFQKNDLDKAAHFFELAIKNNPIYIDAYVNLGAVYERKGDLAQAGAMLAKALCLNLNCARAYYNLGVVWEKAGNLQKALLCYEKAQSLGYVKEALTKRLEIIRKAVSSKD